MAERSSEDKILSGPSYENKQEKYLYNTIKNNEEKMITIYYKMVTVHKYRAFI
jgi:hypothetical protein